MTKIYSISNITHRLINNYINILYAPHKSIFDILIKNVSANFYIYNDQISSYYYDLLISNNILSHHQQYQNVAKHSHMVDLIMVHNSPFGGLKKEDIHLLQQNTFNSYKICFDQKIASEWKIFENEKNKIITYGLPQANINQNRNRKILIINLEKNPNLKSLYEYIQKHIEDCDMLEDFPKNTSIDTLQQLFNNYDICLDISCNINTLFAASCGCQCLTSICNYNNPLIHKITNFADTLTIIQNLSDNNISYGERLAYSKQITDNFDYNTFINRLEQEIQNIKQKGFFKI